jgi:polyphosphate kinase
MKNKKLINREISWLSFNERVLQEAADANVPIVERIRFLGIFSNNLDEFFKVRVATIKRMIDVENRTGSLTREKPSEILNEIQQTVLKQQKKFESIYQELKKDLEKERIIIIDEKQLTRKKAEFVHRYFIEQVLPVLTPIMLHNVKEFPRLKDRSIYLAVKMSSNKGKTENEYAIIEVPTERLGRFLLFPILTRKYLILLDDVIRYGLKIVFSQFHFDHFEAYTIKLTRDAELDIDNDLSKSFLEKIDESVRERSEGQPVRFVYDKEMPSDLLKYLTHRLNLHENDTLIPGGRYHNFKDFMKFPNLGKKHLQYEKQSPLDHPRIHHGQSLFDVVTKKDLLLHFPYQKFTHYINWLREASMDPRVTSIKTTLYRVASDSAVCNALINAALNGKSVHVNIELQARFDEQSNIYWSKRLEEVGAKVTFGIRGLKVHSKLTLISRTENGRTVNYTAIGTGNFHEGTANVYSDLLLITKNKYMAAEVWKIFDFFHNTFKNYSFKYLMVSPNYQRKRLNAMIETEIANAKNGIPAFIILKVNSLVDPDMIRKLYQANNAGVRIKLIIRGTCSLIPGIKGQSENIEAISIVDKYLEHGRIFVFCNGGNELYFISSADWMTRNIDNRIEVSAPIFDKDLQAELKHILDIQLSDNVKARIINETQSNPYRKQPGEKLIRSQSELYNFYKKLSEGKIKE